MLPKGIERSRRVIESLLRLEVNPDRIISSPALRALETARLFASGFDYPEEAIAVDRKIYDGHYSMILDLIYETSDDCGSLMLFGHNPTLTNLANLFLHPGIDELPTSAVVAIEFEAKRWKDIPRADSRKRFIVSPKSLRRP